MLGVAHLLLNESAHPLMSATCPPFFVSTVLSVEICLAKYHSKLVVKLSTLFTLNAVDQYVQIPTLQGQIYGYSNYLMGIFRVIYFMRAETLRMNMYELDAPMNFCF